MPTKTCPGCGAEVPAAALRCKHCFHDFAAEASGRRRYGLVGFLVLLAVMAVIGAGTMWYVRQSSSSAEKIVIDEGTHSVIFTHRTPDHTETDRLNFDSVSKVEVVLGGSKATWEVALVTLDGERRIIKLSDDRSLKGYAEHVAAVLDKPLVQERKVRTFGDD